MQFKQGVRVFSANNQTVGTVDRVVMDPLTKDVTHIVIRHGVFFTEDKIVPIHLIANATQNKITLHEHAGNLHAMLPFEETHYIPVEYHDDGLAVIVPSGYIRPLYPYPPLGTMRMNYPPPPFIAKKEPNIPENTIALKEGAQVISADDKHIGTLERVFMDFRSHHASYVVIVHGLLFKERKLIPTSWIKSIADNEVHLAVKAYLLDTLSAFQESSIST